MYALRRAYLREDAKKCLCCGNWIEGDEYMVFFYEKRKTNYYFHPTCYRLLPQIFDFKNVEEMVQFLICEELIMSHYINGTH